MPNTSDLYCTLFLASTTKYIYKFVYLRLDWDNIICSLNKYHSMK